MDRSTRRDVLLRLRAALDHPTGGATPADVRIETTRYTCPRWVARERDRVFGAWPLAAVHGSEIPTTGDFATLDAAGTPVVVVRRADGSAAAFVNVCRHRGARLVEGASGRCKAFVCPYHAWTYDHDGALIHVPRRAIFSSPTVEERRLIELPTVERHGFLWIALHADAKLDVSAALGAAIDADLASFGLADLTVVRRSDRTCEANWKLVMDAFAEGYHLPALHRQSLSRFFATAALVDDFAPHVRQVGARRALLDGAPDDPEVADLHALTTVFYNLFPNLVLVFHPTWLSALSLWPDGPDTVRVVHRMLARPDRSDTEEDALQRSFEHIDGQVFEREDLHMAQSVQSSLRAGAADPFLLGGGEAGMALFHAALDAAMAAGD